MSDLIKSACPFCGSKDIRFTGYPGMYQNSHCECKDCHTIGPAVFVDDEKAATEAWNRRTQPEVTAPAQGFDRDIVLTAMREIREASRHGETTRIYQIADQFLGSSPPTPLAQDLAQEQAATMLIQRKKIQTLNAEIAELRKKLSGVNSAAHRLAARLCAIPPAKTIRGNDLITREAVMGFVVEWRRQWNEVNEAALASSANALSAGDRVDAGPTDAELLNFVAAHPEMTLRHHKRRWSFVGFTNYEYDAFKTPREAIAAAILQSQKDGHG